MDMGTEAEGLLISIIPVALRINIHVVNIDSSKEAKENPKLPKFSIQDGSKIIKGDM